MYCECDYYVHAEYMIRRAHTMQSDGRGTVCTSSPQYDVSFNVVSHWPGMAGAADQGGPAL